MISIVGFDFSPRTRIVYGIDSIDRLGALTRELGLQRVLLVTDAGLVACGHAEHARQSLETAGVTVTVYDRVRENPTTRDVDECLTVAREAEIDGFVGLGGGSSLDTAKGANFLLTNGGAMLDYWGVGKASKPMLPLVAVPTTAGTGSECQSAALIADEVTHQKMVCLDSKAAARVAVLDPMLTVSQPRHVTACTGIDAIAHAIETAVTTKRNELSAVFSREAFRLTFHHFARVLAQPDDLEARGAMLLGAAYAGLAIELSMLGAAHAAANPLTAHFGTVHGLAVGMLLPHVVRFNAEDPAACRQYHELAVLVGLANDDAPCPQVIDTLCARLTQLVTAMGLERPAIPAHAIPQLAAEATEQWTARFNPRPLTVVDFVKLFQCALEHPDT